MEIIRINFQSGKDEVNAGFLLQRLGFITITDLLGSIEGDGFEFTISNVKELLNIEIELDNIGIERRNYSIDRNVELER